MAMMMTGRVLLVCALCVLWCGAGGGYAWDFGSDGESLNEYYYGAYGVYCNASLNATFCEEKRKAIKLKEAALQKNTARSGEGSGQPNAGGSSGRQAHGSEESGSGQSEGTAGEGTPELNKPGEGGTETPTPLSSPPPTATVTAAQTSATRTPDESDGSPAASHTTSPLLLFLIVCAAAAAVVAA
ncbi:Mucin-associated surface protein (MASP) [Trypanosoma cruzi]|uniref:Mucin-associated surface protein (MASP), putative n=2 Tax=Trypanosoma cruzi TaxID=5693 RepID=Q4DBE8_TRYCC|nr:mucin-associated surface protein (MASP), putative [Trypanosoma cruzi]EAN89850.1 mucin-associated surface protein (MASP), putative [Trypanosoma cruzi]PWU99600.1 Mucin-associated surface protein (MASP) [Trypanosoma cruzi]|eukprot:XP_811701.1 mucin-associated surface protein (MASP) [Trypanosoma cruzi strain CL Brener]